MPRSARSNGQGRTVVADKREAILNAAVKVFAKKVISIQRLPILLKKPESPTARFICISKAKMRFCIRFLTARWRNLSAKENAKSPTSKNADERLRRIAQLHLEKLSADRDLAIVFQVELRGSTKFMEEFSAAGFADYLDIITETIKDGQKSGVFRKGLKPIVCAKILYGALDEMVTNWILSKKSYPLAADGRCSFRNIFRRRFAKMK